MAQYPQPVEPAHPLNPLLTPAPPTHVVCEGREVLLQPQPLREPHVEVGVEWHLADIPAEPLVAHDPLDELVVISVDEVGADPHRFLAHDVDHVLDRLQEVIHGRIPAVTQKPGERSDADQPPGLRDRPQLVIGLVAEWSCSASGLACEYTTGWVLAAMQSAVVRGPTWDRSQTTRNRFISASTSWPKSLRPESWVS